MAIPLWGAGAVFLFLLLTEYLHGRRVRRVAPLAFGPAGRPRGWVRIVTPFRILCLCGMTWALLTLLLLRGAGQGTPGGPGGPSGGGEQALFILDYSPSMTLVDAGPRGDISRKERMKQVMLSLLDRMGKHVRYSAACFYTRSYPVVQKAFDKEIIRNVLNDLPVEYAMEQGKTDLGGSVNAALKMIEGHPPRSTTVFICTDGDSIDLPDILPPPASVRALFVLGVGNTMQGMTFDGHVSRQESAQLDRLAGHLRGKYVDVNDRQVSSLDIGHLCREDGFSAERAWTRHGAALFVFAALSALYAAHPLFLEFLGSDWRARPATEPAEEPV